MLDYEVTTSCQRPVYFSFYNYKEDVIINENIETDCNYLEENNSHVLIQLGEGYQNDSIVISIGDSVILQGRFSTNGSIDRVDNGCILYDLNRSLNRTVKIFIVNRNSCLQIPLIQKYGIIDITFTLKYWRISYSDYVCTEM